MAHARLSPSSAETWCNCPGSVNLIAKCNVPDTSSVYADEGTAAHELLEQCLLNDADPENYRDHVFAVNGNGYIVDDDMIDAVGVALKYVRAREASAFTSVLIPERKVYPDKLMGRDDCHGTGDITIGFDETLEIHDYKHGRGVVVEASGNLQTLLYGIGALADLEPEVRKKIKTLTTGIIQPRASHPEGPIRTCTYPIETVYQWLMWFIDRAKATEDPNAPRIPGEKQCRWCRAKAECPELHNKALSVFDAVDTTSLEPAVLRDPELLSMEQINLIDQMGDLVKAHIEAVRGYKLAQMKAGVDFPGSKLVRGAQGHRKFEDPDKMPAWLSRNFGLTKKEVTTPGKVLAPAKIVALCKKSPKANEKKLALLEAKITRPEGAICIAPASDPRPAVMNSLEDAFKDVPNQPGETT
jgi:hypothetical protein